MTSGAQEQVEHNGCPLSSLVLTLLRCCALWRDRLTYDWPCTLSISEVQCHVTVPSAPQPKEYSAGLLLCRCLCARLSPNLLAPEHLDALLQLVVEEQGNKSDVTFLPAVLSLLVASAAAAPPLFANVGHQVSPTCFLAATGCYSAAAASTMESQ